MSKDGELYQRAAKTARHYAPLEPPATKVIRALLSACNRKDRELRDWKEGRAHRALENENLSLISANSYLTEMLRKQKESK